MVRVDVDRRRLTVVCRQWHVHKLAVFGSVLREDFGPDSDVDALVEFEAGHTPGLDFFRLQQELSELFGRKVDLNTPADLSRYFRDRVLAEAEVLYGGA